MARHTKRDHNGHAPSDAQIRQRQLSWLIRITEGAEANFCAALGHNATKLSAEEFREVNKLRKELLALSRSFRTFERKCK